MIQLSGGEKIVCEPVQSGVIRSIEDAEYPKGSGRIGDQITLRMETGIGGTLAVLVKSGTAARMGLKVGMRMRYLSLLEVDPNQEGCVLPVPDGTLERRMEESKVTISISERGGYLGVANSLDGETYPCVWDASDNGMGQRLSPGSVERLGLKPGDRVVMRTTFEVVRTDAGPTEPEGSWLTRPSLL